MSETSSTLLDTSSSMIDTTSSELGANLHAYSGTNASSFNYPSTAASLASSDVDYQRDLTISESTLPLSRPLSRASTTSCMSVTLFKDGVEGRRVHRSGIPNYPYNLIATMSDNRHTKPYTALNNANSLNNEDYSDPESQELQETSDNDKSTIDMPSGPPVSLNEKMSLLKTGQVQSHHHMNPDGPSVGPVVFKKEADGNGGSVDSDDVSMSDYTRFQNEAARDFNDL